MFIASVRFLLCTFAVLCCSTTASVMSSHSPGLLVPGSSLVSSRTNAVNMALRLRGGGKSAQLVASQEEFDRYISGSGNKLVVVDFTAKWCGPCQRIAPEFENMAAEFGDVLFLKVDVDELQSTAEACGVSCMPTFQFYKSGKKVKTIEGADEEKLRSMVQSLSQAVPSA